MQQRRTGRFSPRLLPTKELVEEVNYTRYSFRCTELTSTLNHKLKVKASRSQATGVYMLVLCIVASISATLAIQTEEAATLTPTTGVSPNVPPMPNSTDTGLFESTAPASFPAAAEDLTAPALNLNTNVKLKPINFTLVDEMFQQVLADNEVAKKWRDMDTHIQDGVKSILKMVFPQIVALSQDAKVSGDCSGGILKWILSLRNLRSWAIKMLDATGKPTAGIFRGSLNMLGNYRQCLSIRAPDEDEIEITEQFEEYFRGQFCAIHLRPWMPAKTPYYHLNSTIESLVKDYKYYEKMLYDDLAEIAVAFNFVNIQFDLCVPSTCSMADIQRVADLISSKVEMRAKVVRCDIAPRDPSIFRFIDRTTYFWLLAALALVIITVIATVLKCLSMDAKSTGSDPSRTILQSLCFIECLKDRWRVELFRYRKRKNIESEQEQVRSEPTTGNFYSASQMDPQLSKELAQSNVEPKPLYGIRTIIVLWFIIVQMTVELKYQYLRESLVLRDMILSYWPFQIIINSSFIYDSFILVTAFAYGYHCLEFTLKQLVRYIVDKYIGQVLPVIALIALVTSTPLLAIESPNWHNFVDQQSMICKSNGPLNLIFLQNFIAYDNICLPHTWLLCVELQLILLSLPVVLLLKKSFLATEDLIIIGGRRDEMVAEDSGKLAISWMFQVILTRLVRTTAGLISITLILLGAMLNFGYVYLNQLPPTWFYTFPDPSQKNYYFSSYFTKSWTHLSVFVIGLVGGHICRASIRLECLQVSLLHNQRLFGNAGKDRSVTSGNRLWSPSMTNNSDSSTNNSELTISTGISTIMSMEQQHQKSSQSRSEFEPRFSNRLEPVRSDKSYLLQVAALGCMAALIFSTYSWSTHQVPTPLVSALYDSLSRIVWSLALVSIMIHLCFSVSSLALDSSKSVVAKLLSLPICVRLGRLSFLAFLLTPYVNTFILAISEQSLFPSLILIFHFIVGNIVIIYSLALLMAITIEQPILRLFRFKLM